jgi:hypothetical protein
MAEATKTIQKTTIQDALRNAGARFARTSTTLAEGLDHSRKAFGHAHDAEWHLKASVAALREVDAHMGTEMGLEGAKDLLLRRIAQLDTDIETLRAIQRRIASCRGTTADVLGNLSTYAMARADAVFGRALRKYDKVPSAPGQGIELAEAEVPSDPEIKLPSITLREHGKSCVEAEFEIDVDPFTVAVALLEASAEHANAAGESFTSASLSMIGMAHSYSEVRDSIEGNPNTPTLASAKKELARVVEETDDSRGVLATLGKGVDETVTGVLEALDLAMRKVLGLAINPKTAGAVSATAEAGESKEEASPGGDGANGADAGSGGPGADMGDRTPGPEDLGNHSADWAGTHSGEEDGHDVDMTTPAPDLGEGIAWDSCCREIKGGNASAPVAYLATYGNGRLTEALAELEALAGSKPEAGSGQEDWPQRAICGLDAIARGKDKTAAHAAAQMLHRLSQREDILPAVKEDAGAAFFGLPDETAQE